MTVCAAGKIDSAFTRKNMALALEAAIDAGKEIMGVYATEFEVELKDNRSPVTRADKLAHKAIVNLISASGLHVLSEEGKDIPFRERKRWDIYWLVDPLDGTKEFINRNGEFTVNLALIAGNTPVLGVVLAPAIDRLYFGIQGQGAFRLDGVSSLDCKTGNIYEQATRLAARLPLQKTSNELYTVVGSRSHGGEHLELYLEKLRKKYGQIIFKPAGSSLKICLVAEASVHQYPRLGTTMEWDIAAGHAVAAAAGAEVYQYESGSPLLYNKKDLRNPWFVVEKKK